MIFRRKFLCLTSTRIRNFFEAPNSTEQSQEIRLEEAVRLREIRCQQEQQIDLCLLARASRSNRSKERQVAVFTHCKQPNMLFHGLCPSCYAWADWCYGMLKINDRNVVKKIKSYRTKMKTSIANIWKFSQEMFKA